MNRLGFVVVYLLHWLWGEMNVKNSQESVVDGDIVDPVVKLIWEISRSPQQMSTSCFLKGCAGSAAACCTAVTWTVVTPRESSLRSPLDVPWRGVESTKCRGLVTADDVSGGSHEWGRMAAIGTRPWSTAAGIGCGPMPTVWAGTKAHCCWPVAGEWKRLAWPQITGCPPGSIWATCNGAWIPKAIGAAWAAKDCCAHWAAWRAPMVIYPEIHKHHQWHSVKTWPRISTENGSCYSTRGHGRWAEMGEEFWVELSSSSSRIQCVSRRCWHLWQQW